MSGAEFKAKTGLEAMCGVKMRHETEGLKMKGYHPKNPVKLLLTDGPLYLQNIQLDTFRFPLSYTELHHK